MCGDGDVRLIEGDTEREGRVEMCYNGVWGAVCADGWNDIAANIVCTQLGYKNQYSSPGELVYQGVLAMKYTEY